MWKPVVGYEENYEVSNLGRIKSLIKVRWLEKRGIHESDDIYMAQNVSRLNRSYISLNKKGVQKNYSVHRVVAFAFLENPNDYPCINHIDGNPQNNNLSNLEWCDHSYNMRHAYEIGIRFGTTSKGSSNNKAKLNADKVRCIRKWRRSNPSFFTVSRLAECYGVSPKTIKLVENRTYWKHVL